MPTLRDFVGRFRPAGAPGAAAPAGVPADRVSERAAELGPVFDELREAVNEAEAIRAHAAREAERRRSAATQRVVELLADARREADSARSSAAAAVAASASGEEEAVLDRARTDAEVISRRASARLPQLVDRVIAAVEALGTVPDAGSVR